MSTKHEQKEEQFESGCIVQSKEDQHCMKCSAPMPPFFWGENGGQSTCKSCGFKHPCCDT